MKGKTVGNRTRSWFTVAHYLSRVTVREKEGCAAQGVG